MTPTILAILAQADAPSIPQQPPAPNIASMLPMLGAGALFVFFMISSSRKQKKAQMDLLANVKKNDRVETASGIFGTVVSLKDAEDEVTLRTDDSTNSRIRVRKSSIARIIAGDDEAKGPDAKS